VEWKINGSYSAWVAKGYAVTKDGRAWSFWRSEGPKKANKSVVDMNIPPRQLAPRLSRHGYSRIQINRKDFAVHKLVLTAWRGPPREDQETRHLNGIRSDNRLENLAWGTHDENHEDKVSHGNLITGTDHPNSKLTVKLVVDARKLWLAGKTLPQIIEKLNLTVSKASIHEAIVGKTWQHVTEIPPVLNRGRISKKEKP
jgi:hypothetical protein